MLLNASAAALRSLHRGKLYMAIAVLGLGVGLCVALLAALVIRSQYSFDHFIPGYRDLYLATLDMRAPGRPSQVIPETPAQIAGLMRGRYPQVQSVTRIAGQRVALRAGDVELSTEIYSVDANFFDTLPLAVYAGDPAAALAQPDRVVMTREYARRLFGDLPPLGRVVEVLLRDGSRQVVTVGALLEDIPAERSQLQSQVLVSATAAWTRLARLDARTTRVQGLSSEVRTVVRLQPGASPVPMGDTMPAMLEQFVRESGALKGEAWNGPRLGLLRIDRVNTDPAMNEGFETRILMTIVLGGVVLAIACLNFVNLLTARAGMRALEVGVRKLAGAGRGTLAIQFLGEVFVLVVVAMLLAMAMTELLLPWTNAFLEADARFDYSNDVAVLVAMLLAALLLGLVAGFWPALVLSALRPLGAMHGAGLARRGGGRLRQVLVGAQFALLIGLAVAAGVVFLQREYAMRLALRFADGHMVVAEMGCTPARLAGLRRLTGVRDAACSDTTLIGDGFGASSGKTRDGQPITINVSWIDDHALGMYGIKPIAGRMLLPADFDAGTGRPSTNYLINEAAVRRLGFDSAATAIGDYPLVNGLKHIVGVVPDFSMGPVSRRIEPTVFYADPNNFSRVSIRLQGDDIPAALSAIDGIWRTTGGNGRLNRFFFEERVEQRYQSMLREAQAFGALSAVAVALACLGLLGLAATVAEQRTREIGIRKALGATTGEVLRLLLWQFSKPVLWANLIAWPVAGWAMQRWLDGFVYHIALPLWLFPAITVATLLIALATVSVHALRVARARPMAALRCE
jgi:putative ABC transport system permease protein